MQDSASNRKASPFETDTAGACHQRIAALARLLVAAAGTSAAARAQPGPQIESGKLWARGATTAVPAFFARRFAPIASVVRDFAVKAWHGMLAPAIGPLPSREQGSL